MSRQIGRMKKKEASSSLNITSMMDMFTIILLFLLKSYSTEGAIIASADNLVLPNSVSKEKPTEIGLNMSLTGESVMIDNKPIMDTKELRALDDSLFIVDSVKVPTVLDNELKAQRAKEMKFVEAGLQNEVKANIVIQVDKNMDFNVLYKIMKICGRNKYLELRFAVMMREG